MMGMTLFSFIVAICAIRSININILACRLYWSPIAASAEASALVIKELAHSGHCFPKPCLFLLRSADHPGPLSNPSLDFPS